MLTRSKHPRHKPVMVITDVPVKTELKDGEKFSSASNLGLLTALRTGRVNSFNSIKVENHTGINATEVFSTYLDYTYYGESEDTDEGLEKNYDFAKEFKKRKDLVVESVYIDAGFTETLYFAKDDEGKDAGNSYKPIPHQKDLYVSVRLWNSICATVEEIKKVQPKLIIIPSKWSLFLLCGVGTYTQNASKGQDRKPLGGLATYRSSILQLHPCWQIEEPCIVVPIYHTVHAMAMPDKVTTMELDLQKLGWMHKVIQEKGVEYYIKPDKKYILGTEKKLVLDYLDGILNVLNQQPTYLSADVETMFKSIIDCIGITISPDEGICIPFASVSNPNIWSIEDEIEIMCKIKEVLEHPNALHIGQNYAYDCQYYYKLWGMDINPAEDTMVLHHVLFNYLPKDLAFLASLYAEHFTYWKDELEATKESPETRWIYNCKDICYTLEILEILLDLIKNDPDKRLYDLYRFQIDELHPELVLTMNTGVRIDKERKENLFKFYSEILESIPEKINNLLGFEFNANSHIQKKKLFTDFFGIKLISKKVKGKGLVETCDAKATLFYIEEYPEYAPFLTVLAEFSALSKFTKNFLGMLLDDDERARTQYRITGTKLGRLASTKNVWGKGSNFNALVA